MGRHSITIPLVQYIAGKRNIEMDNAVHPLQRTPINKRRKVYDAIVPTSVCYCSYLFKITRRWNTVSTEHVPDIISGGKFRKKFAAEAVAEIIDPRCGK